MNKNNIFSLLIFTTLVSAVIVIGYISMINSMELPVNTAEPIGELPIFVIGVIVGMALILFVIFAPFSPKLKEAAK